MKMFFCVIKIATIILATCQLSAAATLPKSEQKLEPKIINGSFENESDIQENTIMMDKAAGNQKFKEQQQRGRWNKVAWGTEKATSEALEIIKRSDAPDGNYVAEIHNKVNQISAFATYASDLVPGKWYEVSCKISTEDLIGQGAFLNVEFWEDDYSHGSVDSEHLVGTNPWRDAKVRFIASSERLSTKISLWAFGGPGKVWFDDVKIRRIATPTIDNSQRRIIDAPFWGMFTCYANYLHQYGKDMKDAGVYWQRQGCSALAPEQQKFAEENDMAFQMCLDGMPAPTDKADLCWPITTSSEYKKYAENCARSAGKSIRIFEIFNEANVLVEWTLPAYANLLLLAGETIKAIKPDAIFATGGFTSPQIGYTESLLNLGAGKFLDIILVHPYGLDEPLDSQLFALAEVCNRTGRPELAIAINETGFPTWDPATGFGVNNWFVSEREQAIRVVKLHLQALAHKLSFVTYLGWNNFTEQSDMAMNMGLVRVDGSPKPALHAYKFMTETLGPKARIIDWTYREDGTRVYKYDLDARGSLWVVWNALRDAEVSVDVGDSKVFPCDIYGTKLTVKPVFGHVTIKANYSPVYLVPIKENIE